MRALRLLIIVGLAGIAYVASGQTPGNTGVEGVIKVSPSQPGPTKTDAPSSVPLQNVTFLVEGESGATTSFTTDDAGRFRVSLPPGHYKISRKGERSALGHFGPFDVDIVTGKMTKVEWECDSGLR